LNPAQRAARLLAFAVFALILSPAAASGGQALPSGQSAGLPANAATTNQDVSETLTVTKTGNVHGGTVKSSPAGIDCELTQLTCAYQFTQGTSVTLTAWGSLHTTFEGWSGACTGTGTCTVTMNGATSVTADFKLTGGPPVFGSPCVVPNVKGKTLKAAKRALKAHNCSLGKVKHSFAAEVRNGRVISQKPKPHKRLPHGAKVNLVVSKGKTLEPDR
jgi:hypothetical protein